MRKTNLTNFSSLQKAIEGKKKNAKWNEENLVKVANNLNLTPPPPWVKRLSI